MRPMLGPAPCQRCGMLLYYVRFRTLGRNGIDGGHHDGWWESHVSETRGERWRAHRCGARLR